MFYRIFNFKRTALSHRYSVYLLFFGAMTALVGCGGNANRSSSGIDQSLINPYPGPTPSPTPSYPSGGGGWGYSANYSLAGYTGTGSTYTFPQPIDTDNIMRVRITAGPGGPLSDPNYSNFVANYGCISYQVTVAGTTRSTGMLSVQANGGYCPGTYQGQWVQSPHSAVIDFSDLMSPGHGPVTVTIGQAMYDFYCAYYYSWGYTYSPYNNWCPLKSVYRSHTVTGTMEVQVNGS